MIDNTIQSKLNELKENDLDVSIETSMVYVNEDGVAMCAKLHKDGCKVSSGHAYVPFSEAGPKAMEWAETIALRRAIGFLMRNHSPSVEELHEAGSRQAKKMIEEYKDGVATWILAGYIKATTNEVIKSHLQSAMDHIMSQEAKKNK